MKTRVQVLTSEQFTKHYEHGKSETWICKCAMYDDKGQIENVGTLRVPAAIYPFTSEAPHGDYELDYKAGRKYGDDGIGGVLCSFEAVKAAKPAASVQHQAGVKAA